MSNHLFAAIEKYGNLRAELMRDIFEKADDSTRDETERKINNQMKKIADILEGKDDEYNLHLTEQLSKRWFGHDAGHTIITERQTVEEWQANGKPATWMLVETDSQYSVYVDVSYGWLALFENGTLMGAGKTQIAHTECVVLDKDYYSTTKYIWK